MSIEFRPRIPFTPEQLDSLDSEEKKNRLIELLQRRMYYQPQYLAEAEAILTMIKDGLFITGRPVGVDRRDWAQDMAMIFYTLAGAVNASEAFTALTDLEENPNYPANKRINYIFKNILLPKAKRVGIVDEETGMLPLKALPKGEIRQHISFLKRTFTPEQLADPSWQAAIIEQLTEKFPGIPWITKWQGFQRYLNLSDYVKKGERPHRLVQPDRDADLSEAGDENSTEDKDVDQAE